MLIDAVWLGWVTKPTLLISAADTTWLFRHFSFEVLLKSCAEVISDVLRGVQWPYIYETSHPPGSQSCRPAIGFCPFDLIVYYLPANSFIFNLFLWPAAMDSDTVFFFFFTRARHTSPWIIWSYSWARCYHSWTRACSARLTQARRRHSQSSCFLHFSTFCSHFTVAIF